MKKTLMTVLATVMVLLLAACGGTSSESEVAPSNIGKTETTDEKEMTEGAKQESNSETISANGYTIHIVDLHKTKDSNGEPMAAAEFLFTNDNAEPVSFMGAATFIAFQNGIELTEDEMFLENDYDWDSYYTEIKDGATISVFCPIPLQNETDPVELTVEIMDFTDWTSEASTTVKFNLDSDTELTFRDEVKQTDKANEQEDTTVVEEKEGASSDTISANGYTVQIVDLHKTKDSNGEPMAAAEFSFTNDNAEPVSFMGAATFIAFQNGIELTEDEMFLENDYDWDSYYTEIKDGATISVFCPIPLQNETDPVELTVEIMDFTDWSSEASTTRIFDLN